MYSDLLKDHQAEVSMLKSHSSAAKKRASKLAEQMAKTVHSDIEKRVVKIAQTQHEIDREISSLASASTQFQKQSETWLSQASRLTEATKTLGDVTNWVDSINWDINAILRVLKNIEHKHK
ncbi:hypothetical protein RCL1_006069 [Eukaryota sp. TZLM3-RCL]